MEEIIVAKYGGSSVADADGIRNISNIIRADSRRKHIVISGAGKNRVHKWKVTDYLYNICDRRGLNLNNISYESNNLSEHQLVEQILDRHKEIVTNLGISKDIATGKDVLTDIVNELYNSIKSNHVDTIARFAEYSLSKIFSAVTGFKFIDPTQLIYIDESGNPDNEVTKLWMSDLLKYDYTIVPGFYGNASKNRNNPLIKTLSRGGSDYTASLVAAGINAQIYENWSDKNGLFVIDPKLAMGEEVPLIEKISFLNARELSYSGASILHDETLKPLTKKNIILNIKNSFNPLHPGTVIMPEYTSQEKVIGIAGRKNFSSIYIKKPFMNNIVGYMKNIFDILADHNISIEIDPPGIDYFTVVINNSYINDKKNFNNALNKIKIFNNDEVKVSEVALISVVSGNGHCSEINYRTFNSLYKKNIETPIISRGANNSIILGIENKDYEFAMYNLFKEFFK